MLKVLKEDWVDTLTISKQATEQFKISKSMHVNNKELSSFLKELTTFHNERKGLRENSLEDVISCYPISSKHNPFYNQSFNGGYCTRLMVNWELLFSSILDAYENKKESVKQTIKK